MKKVILAPDSFKGSLSAVQLCMIMEEEIHQIFKTCDIISIPIADGGEGTVDAFLHALGGVRVQETVSGPFHETIPSFYGWLPTLDTAVIEMAAAAGLSLAAGREDPSQATTYGVGQLMRRAVEAGAKRLLIGLGGSCTNDGGCGLAAALGVRFYDKNGQAFLPVGRTLSQIARIDTGEARAFLSNVTITAMCDVENPLSGPQGAAYVFAPQKGADRDMVRLLDEGLTHYGTLLEKMPGGSGVSTLPGAGAAGGLGAGLHALLGASLTPGIDVILDTVSFDQLLDHCDLVITGEGKMDGQSLRGKAAIGIARRARTKRVPVCAFVGDVMDQQLTDALQTGLTAVFSIHRQTLPLKQAIARTESDLRAALSNLMRLIQALSSGSA